MNIRMKIAGCVGGAFFLAASVLASQTAIAAETKIGVINMKQVLATSKAGKDAQTAIEKKMKELQASFKKDEESLIALQKEIEKKSSAWSDEVKQEKAIEFQKKRRDLGVKQEDANLELKNMREQHVNPILKELEKVVTSYGKEQGYTLILPRNGLLFAAESVDISEEITKALNEGMK